MAFTGYLDIPPELQALFSRLMSVLYARQKGVVRKHGYLMSRQKILNVTNRSLLPEIRDLRNTLTPEQITAWKSAAGSSGLNWWNLFVQDTAYRIKHGINGLWVPNDIYQYKVGRVEIQAPADKVKLAQYHPRKYYISKKVRGNTTVREDVAIYENFVLPLEIGLSYRSNLTPTKPEPEVKFYAIIKSNYQGRTFETEVAVNLEVSSGWRRATINCAEVFGSPRSYNLFIILDGVRGSFEFDNILSKHSGTNFARDFRCNDVNNTLTKTHYMIERSWEETFLPVGTAFDSVYPEPSELP